MTRHRNKLGFTLMELVLVLVIIAVSASVAIPALRGFVRARRLPNTAQEFMIAARWCRAQAVGEGTTYHLNLDIENSAWSITKDDGTTNFVDVTNDFILTKMTMPDGIEMKTDIQVNPDDKLRYISFDPGGHTDVGTVQFTCDGDEVDVVCDTPLGSYHLVTGAAR